MTPQEAIELVEQCGLNIEGMKYVECEKVILNALEKQIPKKLRVDDEGWLCCPKCNETFKLHNQYYERNRYCGNCGQKIDWSEVDAKKRSCLYDR